MPDHSKAFWESFPNLAPGAITGKLGKTIPWHTDAASPRSSQTFCVSAFGAILGQPSRTSVCHSLLTSVFKDLPLENEKWDVRLEYSDRVPFNECLGTPTQVDVALLGSKSTFTIESKFVVDALEGLGICGKYKDKSCKGFYGPGADTKSDTNWCVLERWDGARTPRLYWTLGRSYFQPKVFEMQSAESECPFSGSNYQLMRNFLVAASIAQKRSKLTLAQLFYALAPEAKSC